MFNIRRIRGAVLIIGMTVLVSVLAACGGSTGNAEPISEAPQATHTPSPTPMATAKPTSPVSDSDSDILAQGKLIFEETAGGVGCASCHGMEGKGNTTVGAPDNRGATEAQVRQALVDVEMMRSIKLSDAEISAVTIYLQYLNEQP